MSRLHSAKGLTSVPDAAWETARRRERIVRALLQNPVAYGARSEAVAAAAAELDVTIQYLYRLIKVYEADPRTRSLCHCWVKGAKIGQSISTGLALFLSVPFPLGFQNCLYDFTDPVQASRFLGIHTSSSALIRRAPSVGSHSPGRRD